MVVEMTKILNFDSNLKYKKKYWYICFVYLGIKSIKRILQHETMMGVMGERCNCFLLHS